MSQENELRDQLRKELDEKGIEYSERFGVKRLQALLGVEPSEESEPSEAPETPNEPVPEPEATAKAYDYTVFNRFGQPLRDYTLEMVGAKAEECARSYAKKVSGTYRPKV